MTTGTVNANLEAIVRVTVAGADGKQQIVDTLLDTGFNGSLTLPRSLVESLALVRDCSRSGTLADGRTIVFDVYRGTVIWNGVPPGR